MGMDTFLYYARVVDLIILVVLITIVAQPAYLTKETMHKTLNLLDYVASHPDAILTYSASNMVRKMHRDAAYQIEPNARGSEIRALFLSS